MVDRRNWLLMSLEPSIRARFEPRMRRVRLARDEVLQALERSGEDGALTATQETLAEMLGVQRTTVTAALSQLQAAGAVRTGRGAVQVLDRQALEQAACCCRETIRRARAEIYASDA